jgi:hypothetical protein
VDLFFGSDINQGVERDSGTWTNGALTSESPRFPPTCKPDTLYISERKGHLNA